MTEALGEGQKALGQKGRPNGLTKPRVGGTRDQSNLTITVLGPEAEGGARRGAAAPQRRAAAAALRDQVMLCGMRF